MCSSDLVAEALGDLAALLANSQQPAGFWKYEGQGQKRPDPEAHEATTLWTVLAMNEIKSPALEPARAKALTWLKDKKVNDGIESVVLRLALAAQDKDATAVAELTKELVSRQHADGSCSWRKDFPGDPYATGQALYGLSFADPKTTAEAVGKARKYLLDKQKPDGSWYSPTKKPNVPDNAIALYWGSAWATIGLTRTLPLASD